MCQMGIVRPNFELHILCALFYGVALLETRPSASRHMHISVSVFRCRFH